MRRSCKKICPIKSKLMVAQPKFLHSMTLGRSMSTSRAVGEIHVNLGEKADSAIARFPVMHDHGRYYAKRLQDFEREKEKFIRWGDDKQAQKMELMTAWERKRIKYRTWSERCRVYDEEARDVFAGRQPSRKSASRASSRQPGTPAYAASPAPHYVSAHDRIRGLRRMYGASTPVPLRTGSSPTSRSRATSVVSEEPPPLVRSRSTGWETITHDIHAPCRDGSPSRSSPFQPSRERHIRLDRSVASSQYFDADPSLLDDQTDFEAARAQFAAVTLSNRVTPVPTLAGASTNGSGLSNDDSGYGASGSTSFDRSNLRWLTGDNEKREGSTHKSWHDAWERTEQTGKRHDRREGQIFRNQDETHGWGIGLAQEDHRLATV